MMPPKPNFEGKSWDWLDGFKKGMLYAQSVYTQDLIKEIDKVTETEMRHHQEQRLAAAKGQAA